MSHLRILLRKRGVGEGDGGVRYVRLPRPLHEALTTLDYHNRRIKVFDVTAETFVGSEPAEALVQELEEGRVFTKLTLYALDPRGEHSERWASAGFREEGVIRSFYEDGSDATVRARYFDDARAEEPDRDAHEAVLEIARSKSGGAAPLPEGYRMRLASAEDAERLSGLMQTVFDEYPSDLSPDHLARQIATHRTVFRLVQDANGTLAAAASAELDLGRRTAELTDCVTLPSERGRGLSSALVDRLHDDLKERYGIRSAYSLARAGEVGINCVFSRLGYEYTGRLVNNCRMPDGWESMNVWCRPLDG